MYNLIVSKVGDKFDVLDYINEKTSDEELEKIMSAESDYVVRRIMDEKPDLSEEEFYEKVEPTLDLFLDNEGYELTFPNWCESKDIEPDVLYVVIEEKKNDEEEPIKVHGLFINEFDAYAKTKSLIQHNDLELMENPPFHYKRLFKLNIIDINAQIPGANEEPHYVKYNYEKGEFEI